MTPVIRRSCRFYLWLPIAANAVVISSSLGAGAFQAFALSLSLCALASFGFLINDLHDRQVDLENRANRLEDASDEERNIALYSSFSFALVGLSSAAVLGLSGFFLALLIGVGLVSYTLFVRSRVLFATVLAAGLNTSPLIAPILVFDGEVTSFHWFFAFSAWVVFVGREICLDIKDLPGDRVGNRKTIPSVLGVKLSSRIASSLVSIGAGLFFSSSLDYSPSAQLASATTLILLVFPAVLVFFSGGSIQSVLRLTSWSRLGMVLAACSSALVLLGG